MVDEKDQIDIELQGTEFECNSWQESLGADENEEGGGPLYIVCIKSFRTRLLDEDNFAGGTKYLIDCLRPHLIAEDSPGITTFKWKQVKVKTQKDERTEVFIFKRKE